MNLNVNQFLPSMSSLPYGMREVVDKLTNVVMNYTDVEIKVLNATNDDNWGPHGKAMQEIADLTFYPSSLNEVMRMIWKRLSVATATTHPVRVYKTLVLLTYLVKHGSVRVIEEINDRIDTVKYIKNAYATDPNKRSPSFANVSVKIDDLLQIVSDEDRLMDEREKAKELKKKNIAANVISAAHGETSRKTPANLSEFNFEGRWKSTTPGIAEKFADFTEKVKDFVLDVGGGAVDDDQSSTDSAESGNHHEPDKWEVPKIDRRRTSEPIRKIQMGQIKNDGDDADDDFSDFQEAQKPVEQIRPLSASEGSSFIFENSSLINLEETNDLFDLFSSSNDQVEKTNLPNTQPDLVDDLFAFNNQGPAKSTANEPNRLLDDLFDNTAEELDFFAKTNQPTTVHNDLFDLIATANVQTSSETIKTATHRTYAKPPKPIGSLEELEKKISSDLANFSLTETPKPNNIHHKDYKSMKHTGRFE